MDYTVSNHRHYADFTIIPNTILRQTELSFFEKGLLCYLLSLPKDWTININYIVENFGESERAILKAFKKLIEVGYCRRTPLRKNGKLCGQHYQITDIANDFSAPTKNEGTDIADPANSRPAQNADPTKNEGTEKEYTLFNEENISNKEKRGTPAKTSERKCLFSDSKFFDFEKFKAQFADPEFSDVDIFYYYNRVKNWSGSEGKKKCDWILTAKNWMMDDNNKGKLKKISGTGGLSPDALQYLQDMAD